MHKTYVTFWKSGHHHEIDGVFFHGNTIAVIEADDAEQGRQRAIQAFGFEYFHIIPEEEADIDYLKNRFGMLVYVPESVWYYSDQIERLGTDNLQFKISSSHGSTEMIDFNTRSIAELEILIEKWENLQ